MSLRICNSPSREPGHWEGPSSCRHKRVARSCRAVIITLPGMVVKRAMWLQAPEFLHQYDLLGPVPASGVCLAHSAVPSSALYRGGSDGRWPASVEGARFEEHSDPACGITPVKVMDTPPPPAPSIAGCPGWPLPRPNRVSFLPPEVCSLFGDLCIQMAGATGEQGL